MEKIKQGYKQTDIGMIPVDWEVYEIEDICKSIVRGPFGGALKKEYFVDFGYKVYEQRNAIYQNVNIGRYYIDCDKFSALKRFVINYKDFIVSCSGTIGRIYQIPKQYEKGIINQALLKLTIDEMKCVNKYFYYVFISNEFQQKIIDSTQGGAMKNLVGMPIFKKTPFALPKSISEQTSIATALSDTDALIAAFDKKIAKKQQIKQGAMQQLLTGKKRLQGFNGEWVEKKLGEVGKISMGQSPSSLFYNCERKGLPLIQGNADIENRQTIIRIYTSQVTKKCDIGDIILSVRAPVGAVAKSTLAACIGRGVCAIKSENDYLFHYLIFIENDWGKYSKGSTFDSISSNELYEVILSIPVSELEQTAIAQILTDMDNEIAKLEKERDKYKEIKAGMMQVLLTGRVRVV